MTDVATEPSESLILDPDKGAFVAIFGRKGSGKSELAKSYFRAYPYDRVVIDANGDVDPAGEYTVAVGPGDFDWPTLEEWATRRRDDPELPPWPSLRYEIDYTDDALVPGTRIPQWLFQADQVVKKASLLGRPVCIWLDEIGELAPAGRCPGNIRQALHKGRHWQATLLMAGPRPVDVEVLVLSQADLACLFELPHELDRQRIAAHLAIPINELGPLLDNLETYGYMVFFAASRTIVIMPPLELTPGH
jgi:energy-coupling factor transporter ATP-binding protein EcfA2